MAEKINFQFHGRDEVLKIINTGGKLAEYLINQKSECPLIGSAIKLGKKLGTGYRGSVFEIKIKGMEKKRYAVKIRNIKLLRESVILKKERSLEEISQDFNLTLGKLYFTGSENKILYPGKNTIYTSEDDEKCIVEKDTYFKRVDGKGDIKIPSGSYVCISPEISEYAIGVLCGELYRKGISANFIDFFGFSTCESKFQNDFSDNEKKTEYFANEYIFMEMVRGSLYDIKECISSKFSKNKYYNQLISEVILIQILHAIATYQGRYKILHGDLHLGNIFVEIIENNTVYNGQNLYEADYFHYKIDDVDIYLPWIPILVKIGDFGLAVKYSDRMIGTVNVLKTGHYQEKMGPWIPNWYCENYDPILVANIFHIINPKNNFIFKIISWMFGSDEKIPRKKWLNDQREKGFFSEMITRPKLEFIAGQFSRGTAKGVLKNKELMKKYLISPTSGKIATLGIV